jgi:hypothetical protein
MQRGALAGERATEWFLCGGYLVLSHHAVRNVCLCILPLVFMARRALGTPRNHATTVAIALAGFTFVAAVVHDVFIAGYGGLARASALVREDLLPDSYPEDAAGFIADAGIEGGLFNEGKWGGYLIARAWPRIHVFVDTRQNLTLEMWRVFLATLSAVERPRALDFAFERWGVELALFRAPTFPLLRAPQRYRLLYRAGDQELYQRVDGAHAAQNFARAERYLRARGVRPDEPLSEAAVRIGAERWLAQPEQKRALAQAKSGLRAPDAAVRGQASAALGELYYRAGLYHEAVRAFQAQPPAQRSTRSLYFAAFSSYAASDLEQAAQLVRSLELRDLSALTRRQLERLAMLRAALPR